MSSPDPLAAIRALTRLARLLDHTDTGLSVPQYRLLAMVDRGDERSGRLASRLVVTKPTVTALADGLVEAGYLSRVGDPADARAVRLRLTDAGRTALGRADTALSERLTPILTAVSDPDTLLNLLAETGQALDASAARVASTAASTAASTVAAR